MSEAEQQPSPAEEEKRPFQFGLSTLFVVMTLWAVFCTLAVTFGLVLGIVLAILAVWLAAIIRAFIRKQYGSACVLSAWLLFPIVIAALLYSPISSPRGPSRGMMCRNNLKGIAVALLQYEVSHGCFPPAYVADESGKPMHSWRVLILPYLGRADVYGKYDFDEPWDGPNNSKLHDTVMDVFRCPSDQQAAKKTDTNYVVVVGPGTIFPGSESVSIDHVYMSDGTTSTLTVVEVANSGIHWMEPRDLHVTQMAPVINPPAGQGISSKHDGGVNVAFADGHVEFLDAENLTPKQLRALLTCDGGEEVDIDEW